MLISEGQVLITGVYRTGSEYLTHLLGLHPNLSATMYRVNVLRFVYNKFNPIMSSENYKLALDITAQRIKERYHITLDLDKIMSIFFQQKCLTYGQFYDVIMSVLYLDGLKTYWAEKCQLLWREIPLFINLMENPKTIHILRDPRSILLSFKAYTNSSDDMYLTAVYNCYDAMKYHFIYKDILDKNNYQAVQYENLVSNPEVIVKQLWKFIGLCEYEIFDSSTQFYDAYNNLWYSNSSFQDNSDAQPYDINLAKNRWEQHLSELEIKLVEYVCGEYMDLLFYKRKYPPIINDQFIYKLTKNKKILNIHDNWKKTGCGIQQFPADPLNPKTWQKTSIKF